MDRLESFGSLREVDSEAHRVTAVISTGDVARDGAIIDPAGWDFSNYDRNPVVLWMHDDGAIPFARTIQHEASKKELVARAEFDMDDPMGETVFRKIASGYINATSVRWLPKRIERKPPPKGVDVPDRLKDHEGNIIWFMEQELLEWSWVTIPSDPGAMILRADGGAFSAADYATPQPRSDEPPTGASVIFPSISAGLSNAAFLYLVERRESAERSTPTTNGNGHHSQPAPDTQALERLLERYLERRDRRLNADDMVISALSRATGKSEERIRREMAEGGI